MKEDQEEVKASRMPSSSFAGADDADEATEAMSVAGHPPFVLTFSNLTYAVDSSWPIRLVRARQRAVLLDSISGRAAEGEILAVIGSSGSGKSTLIDALARRISLPTLPGSGLFLNGHPLPSKTLRAISAYVMQEDLLFPMLTVEETLTFAAEFRLSRHLPAETKRDRVVALIDQLGLGDVAGTIIGDEGRRGVSGGERRRVSIGMEIVHDPVLLFLDEPTSGLDSRNAHAVMLVLRRIARSGSVVVSSIHQPSARILGLVDSLVMLSAGRAVYFGRPDGLAGFFGGLGLRQMRPGENPAEFALDVIHEMEGKQPSLSQSQASFIGFSSVHSSDLTLPAAIRARISRGKLLARDSFLGHASSSSSASEVPEFANTFLTELAVLTRRSFTNSMRTPELFAVLLGTSLVTGGILSSVFFRLDSSPAGVQERLSFFTLAVSTTYYTCANSLPIFIQERNIFLRETSYNSYRRSSYVLSSALVAIPSHLFLSLAFASVTFPGVGLAGGTPGFLFYALMILASFWAGSGFVSFLSAVISNVMLGYIVAVAVLAYFIVFSGFFIHRDRLPGYWIWFHYLSLIKYSYEGVMQSEFGDEKKCFVRGMQVFDATPLRAEADEVKKRVLEMIGSSLGIAISPEACLTTGMDVLRQNGVTLVGRWACLGATLAWGVFFRLLFCLVLLLRGRNRRRAF